MSAALSATVSSKTVHQLFSELPDHLCADKARQQIYNWHVELVGQVPARYTIEVVNGTCAVREQLIGKPDCVLITDANVFAKLCQGQANVDVASLVGELKTDDLSGARQFQRLFAAND